MFYLQRFFHPAFSRKRLPSSCISNYPTVLALPILLLLFLQGCSDSQSQTVNVSIPVLIPQAINLPADGTSLHYYLLVDGKEYLPDTQTSNNAFQVSLQLEAERSYTFSFEVRAENIRYKKQVIVAQTPQEQHFISASDSAANNIDLQAFDYASFNDDNDLLNNWEEVKLGYDPTRKETRLNPPLVLGNAAGGNDFDVATDVAIMPNGDWLVTGYSSSAANMTAMAVWKFHADAQPDTTFDTDGVYTHGNTAGGNGFDRGNAIAILPDDSWVVAGASSSVNGDDDMALWKFASNGQLDVNFDGDGIFTHSNAAGGNYNDDAYDIAVLPGGGWICAGLSANTQSGSSMTLWKFTANGVLDVTFDGDGIFTQNTQILGASKNGAYGIAVFPDGGWLVTGSAADVNGNYDMALWKFLPDGQLDTTFANSGIFTHGNAAGGNGKDVGEKVTLLDSGGWVVAGWSTNPLNFYDMTLWKFGANGKLDTSFGNGGVFTYNNAAGGNSLDVANDIASLPGGGWMVAGYSVNSAGNNDMVLWKFNSSGQLDSSFGFNGIYTHDNAAGGASHDEAIGIAVLSADEWVVVGDSKNNLNYDMVIW